LIWEEKMRQVEMKSGDSREIIGYCDPTNKMRLWVQIRESTKEAKQSWRARLKKSGSKTEQEE
jgi:hypothetical protein